MFLLNKVMLMNKNWAEHEEKRIILKETPACQNVFEVRTQYGVSGGGHIHNIMSRFLQLYTPVQVFLKYLYTGKIQVDYANVIPILQLADKYNVKDLLRWPSFIVFIKNLTNTIFHRVGLDFMSRNVALAARKNQAILHF